jgi:hypothetical protein
MRNHAYAIRGLNLVEKEARHRGLKVDFVPYLKGPKRGRVHLCTELVIDDDKYRIHVLKNCRQQKNRRVQYAQDILSRSTLCEVYGHIFVVKSKKGIVIFIVPSEHLRSSFFSGDHSARSIYIELTGVPGVTFDFWRYRNSWPIPKRRRIK